MSSNLNSAHMQGNCTKDSELRYIPSGQAVLSINLATNREWKNEAGEKQEKVVYTRWSVWGKRAEALVEYIKKGTGLILDGRLEMPNAYEGKDGKPAATNQLTVEELYFQTGKRQGTSEHVDEGPASEPDQAMTPAGEPDSIPF